MYLLFLPSLPNENIKEQMIEQNISLVESNSGSVFFVQEQGTHFAQFYGISAIIEFHFSLNGYNQNKIKCLRGAMQIPKHVFHGYYQLVVSDICGEQ